MSTACACPIRWRRLYSVIEGTRYEVKPSPVDTATSMLFRAWCGGCGAEFTLPFRVGVGVGVGVGHDQAA